MIGNIEKPNRVEMFEGKILEWHNEQGKQICPLCLNEIELYTAQEAGMHSLCANEDITVWRMSDDGGDGGWCTRDFSDIIKEVGGLESCMDDESQYTIHREVMPAVHYFHIGKFKGY